MNLQNRWRKRGLIFISLVLVISAMIYVGNMVLLESEPFTRAESLLKTDHDIQAMYGEIHDIEMKRFKFFYKDNRLSILFRVNLQGDIQEGMAYVKVSQIEEGWDARIVHTEAIAK